MKRFSRSNVVLSITALVMLTAVLALSSSPGLARATSGPPVDLSLFGASLMHARNSHVRISPRVFSFRGTHFLYVDDGTCTDSIDVYKLSNTVTHVGNFPNTGCNGTQGIYFGDQSIAVTKANRTHGPCLVFGDAGNGFVDSFPINADGSPGAQVSHVVDVANTKSKDVHISTNGNLVYVASPSLSGTTSTLESYALGAGCVLTTFMQLSTSQFYISIALVSPTRMLTDDSNAGTIDTYSLNSKGAISLLNSVPGQFGFPDSIAVQSVNTHSGTVTNVFTGHAANTPSEVQGGQYTTTSGAITFLTGSPASDPSGVDGAAVTFSKADSLLIQGEQVTGTLGVYSVQPGTPGVPGSITFKEETPLAVTGEEPEAFAFDGSTLLVAPRFNGDVEACTVSPAGVSGCLSIAVLTSTGGLEGGIAVL
jgi:hypothetical protein